MLRTLIAFVSTCFALPAVAQEVNEPERFAIVVGVADYEDPAIPDVPNALPDAKEIRDWLTTVGGFTDDHVALLLDEGAATLAEAEPGSPIAATRANLLEVTEHWLPDRATAGDTVFFYFSGQAAADGDAQVLLPHDGRASLLADTGIDLDRLGQRMAELSVIPVWWLDTSLAGRGTAFVAADGVRYPADRVPAPDRLVWTAAAADTVAPESATAPHGAFTRALLQALRSSDGRAGRTELALTQTTEVAPYLDRTVSDRFALSAIGTLASQRPEVVPQAGHGDAVQALAWHPSRAWLASGDATGVVQIVDVEQREIRLRFASGRRGVYRLAFDPSGDRLIVVGRDGVVRAWRTLDGDLRWAYPAGKLDQITALAVTADTVAVGTNRGRVIELDPETGARRGRYRIGDSPGKLGPAVTEALAWSADGRWLVSAGDNGELSAWRRTGRSLGKLTYQRRLVFGAPPIRDLVAQPDGTKLVLGLATGETRVLDEATGTVLRSLASTGYEVRRIAMGPSGAEVAVVSDDIRVWGIESDDLPRLTLRSESPAASITWSQDGAFLVSGHEDGAMILWDAATGAEVGRLPGQAAGIRELRVDHERGVLTVAGESGATVWDLVDGQRLAALSGDHREAIAATALFEDDRGGLEVVGGGDAGWLYRWGLPSGQVLDRFPLESAIRDVAALPDGAFVAATDRFVERHTGDAVRTRWASDNDEVRGIERCGPEGHVLLHSDRGLRYRRLVDGTRESSRRRGGAVVRCSPDGAEIAVGRNSGKVDFYDAATLNKAGELAAGAFFKDVTGTFIGDNRITDIAYHPTQPFVATSTLGDPARVWNRTTGKTVSILDTFGTTAIAFAPGRLVVTGSSDGLVQYWDLDTGTLVASLVSLGDEWLAWTPDGLFDGSLEGQRTLFRWRIGDTLHPPSRFHRGFYEPGLLSAISRGRRPRAARDIANLAPPPLVTIVTPKPGTEVSEGTITVEIAIEDRGGGVSEPRLYVNGHRVSRTGARGLQVVGSDGVGGERITFRVDLAEGRNYLRATAFNEEGNWEALGDESNVEWTAPVTEPPKLHVLAVGIDAYRNGRLDLDFARDDAEAIGQFFEPGLFGEIIPHILLDDDATLASIRAEFEAIAKQAAPRDALLVYLAGHGVLDGELFYFLPWDADINSGDALGRTGLSQTELGDQLASVPAAKQLVVLDACHSGAASEAIASVVGRRSSPGLVRAQHRLARSTGAFLVAASTEAQVAHEIPELGHGVLTYAILKGLGDAGPPEANVDRDGNVTVNTLIQYVSDTVPILTDTYRQQRQEVVQAAEGQDFPLVTP